MNKRDEAILSWLINHRPDMVETFEKILKFDESVMNYAIYTAMSIAFDAGRTFQHENPLLDPDDPSVYMP